MSLRTVYLVLCVLGLVLPYSQFIPFLLEHGFDVPLFFQQLFSNWIGGFFGFDVIVSSIVLMVFIVSEAKRLEIKHIWAPIVATLSVGVSLGLPLFLYMRCAKIEAANTLQRNVATNETTG